MIKHSLFFFIALFSLFSIAVKVNKKKLKSDQYQYQTNIINSERYIYSDTTPKRVIIGSSLSSRIVADSIPNVYNLALPGMSVFDGCKIISQRKIFPNVIFIEINILTRGESPELKDELDSRAKNLLKKALPALRNENQPVGIIKGLLRQYKETSISEEPMDQGLFKELLALQIKQYSKTDTVSIFRSVLKLKAEVKKFESHGATVCFFEMPVNNKLSDLAYANNIRGEIHRNFPHNKFIGLPGEQFKTVDGVHLGLIEAARYTTYFRNQINSIRFVKSTKS